MTPGVLTNSRSHGCFRSPYSVPPIHPRQQRIGLDDPVLSPVRVPVHGRADVRMPGNRLQRLHIQVRRRHGDVGVPLWYIKDKPGKP